MYTHRGRERKKLTSGCVAAQGVAAGREGAGGARWRKTAILKKPRFDMKRLKKCRNWTSGFGVAAQGVAGRAGAGGAGLARSSAQSNPAQVPK